MAKKINIIGTQPKRVRVVDEARRRIEPADVPPALGAEHCGERVGANLDQITLAELGAELLRRLRSTGGRPALTDTVDFCRVPLSAEDVKALEKITEQIEQSTGMKPSVGQVVSVIVRDYVKTASVPSHEPAVSATRKDNPSEPAPPSWLPRLSEIAAQASALQKSASTLETAAKEIKEEVDRRTA